ncbi:hypothetical protein [Polaribacter sp. R77954]|uniref:hypothetical protein n=1 Tax=Polaribacter sp. R77954 TaxID=3093870 RepID=UPI0037CC7557
MDDLTDFIINNNLQCFQHKYKKNDLFNKAKLLEKYNNEIIDFNKVEFQALFFFMTTLNLYVKDFNPNLLKNKISMYFDRNVYGTKETESFKFPSEKFIISDMTFCEKSKIELLFLPDFLGFLLKKSREFLIQKNDNNELTRNAHKNYLKIKSSINFHSINIRNEVIENTINLIK